ncbi:hypothetical protein Sango_1541000 [Sesamum angolense]|uniref:Oxidoreductase N-terminal domain-containing protein n=1 Tax=Sesamum angolense TaxID=2727404 RepID=A0AAE1WPB9_9LAMI|nr:hypothetical protein Sango_1541000 [Sesamum angolense]
MAVRNKYVTTKNHIDGAPNASDFCICEESLSVKLQTADHDEGNSGDVVVVQNLYVSIDPYQINRMKTHSCSHDVVPAASAVLPGQAIEQVGGESHGFWEP